MSNIIKPGEDEASFAKPLYTPIKRRSFFMYAGATAGVTALALAGCNDDTENAPNNTVNLGAGDIGVLNYAYALEQLEAAFYTQVIATPYSGMTDTERVAFTAIRQHELIHRDFFKAALTPANAIPALNPNFGAIDFTSRTSVIQYSVIFEDLGVAAYNGAGRLIKDPNYLLLAGKIVSVEARHAAYVRDLQTAGSFAASPIINAMGLDRALSVSEVLAAAQPFIRESISGNQVGV